MSERANELAKAQRGLRGEDKRKKNGENRVMSEDGESGEETDRDGRIVESLLTGR